MVGGVLMNLRSLVNCFGTHEMTLLVNNLIDGRSSLPAISRNLLHFAFLNYYSISYLSCDVICMGSVLRLSWFLLCVDSIHHVFISVD